MQEKMPRGGGGGAHRETGGQPGRKARARTGNRKGPKWAAAEVVGLGGGRMTEGPVLLGGQSCGWPPRERRIHCRWQIQPKAGNGTGQLCFAKNGGG